MERVCSELLRRASGEIDFTVISATLDPSLRPLVRWRRVRLIRRPVPIKFLMFFFLASIELLRTRADLVHTMGAIVPNRIDLSSAHFCHAGFVEQTKQLTVPGSSKLRTLNRAIGRVLAIAAERWCYRRGRTQMIAAVSAQVGQEVARHYPGVRVVQTPNGVDANRFVPDAFLREKVRLELEAPSNGVVVLFVGGNWDQKGLGLAIEGFASARARIPELSSLWVVGAGNIAHYRAVANRSGVDGAVRFLGHRTDVERFYQAADILVLPSLYETFALVAFEAAACSLPIVGTAVGMISELVGPNEAGLIVQHASEDVGNALANLAADPIGRTKMGNAARRRSRAYTWDRSVRSVLDAYGLLLVDKLGVVTS
jgi:glycosyltransferase involved in cell wall biosynthesis